MQLCVPTCFLAPAMLCIRRGVAFWAAVTPAPSLSDRFVGTLSQHIQSSPPPTLPPNLHLRLRNSLPHPTSTDLPHPSSTVWTSKCNPGVASLSHSEDAASRHR